MLLSGGVVHICRGNPRNRTRRYAQQVILSGESHDDQFFSRAERGVSRNGERTAGGALIAEAKPAEHPDGKRQQAADEEQGRDIANRILRKMISIYF